MSARVLGLGHMVEAAVDEGVGWEQLIPLHPLKRGSEAQCLYVFG